MRASYGGADLFHGEHAHADFLELSLDGWSSPALVLCGDAMRVIVCPALDDDGNPTVDPEHVQFARQLAEAAYRYLEVLVQKSLESPYTAN